MSVRRGIEPIIAAVILVAVALILAVVVVGYLMGLFGGLMGGQPQISITNAIAKVDDAGKKVTFELYVVNAGAGSDRILRVGVIYGGKTHPVISGEGATTTATPGDTITDTNAIVVIPANFRGWIVFEWNVSEDTSVSLGDSMVLRIHFERSGVHTINVVVTEQVTSTTTG